LDKFQSRLAGQCRFDLIAVLHKPGLERLADHLFVVHNHNACRKFHTEASPPSFNGLNSFAWDWSCCNAVEALPGTCPPSRPFTGFRGSLILNVDPLPGSLSTSTSP